MNITPQIEGGAWPAKGTEHESFPVQATIFKDGHDVFGSEAVLVDPDGHEIQTASMELIAPGLGRYEAWLTPTYPGDWSFFVRSYADPMATWRHDAELKVEAEQDIDLVFLQAKQLLQREMKAIPAAERPVLKEVIATLSSTHLDPSLRYAAVLSDTVTDILRRYPLRDLVTESGRYPIHVDRLRSLTGSWYEMFPRSAGAHVDEDGHIIPGTLLSATRELDRIAAMGFDVIYLTPISPIGTTHRKGKNNSLVATPDDPGSPYAIGSKDGGHDAIDPALGTFADFDAFVARAHELGMEVAYDFALQTSPDHPWLTSHPEWFTTRADGTIAYAENPPKKYQDIYPLNFDNDPEGLFAEIVRIIDLWISHGVTIFRMDNPHTKPVAFWQRLLAHYRETHPEVVFLAEAFTEPEMMQALGAVGFDLSYSYFAWRNDKKELEDYLWEVSRVTDDRLRPAFFPMTPDILTAYLRDGGVPAFKVRAVLAATGAPTWGIYSGYELADHVQRPGFEEPNDNEKYEVKVRDYDAARANGIADLLTTLNRVRREHTALRRLRGIRINPTDNDHIISFTRYARAEETADGTPDAVITVVNLDTVWTQGATVQIDPTAFGLPADASLTLDVHDELSGQDWVWGNRPFVQLDPLIQAAHVLSVTVRR